LQKGHNRLQTPNKALRVQTSPPNPKEIGERKDGEKRKKREGEGGDFVLEKPGRVLTTHPHVKEKDTVRQWMRKHGRNTQLDSPVRSW